jgi:hypothetical protein
MPLLTASATPSTITQGDSTTLSWSALTASSVTLDGNPVALSGSISVNPSTTTSYTFFATTGGYTPTTQTVIVTVTVDIPMALARFDTWVRSTVGPAAAGAQVYVCTQPTTVGVPPSPLALLYSDNGGAHPISQPLVADGFGHAAAYCTAGSYTVVVVIGGKAQQVYPDQLIGGTAGSSFVLQTNGVPNIVQSLLNLNQSGSITVTADGLGGVTIGGGGSIGGTDEQVQFNQGGTMGGSSNLIWDYTNNALHIGNGTSVFTNRGLVLEQDVANSSNYTQLSRIITSDNPIAGVGNQIVFDRVEYSENTSHTPDLVTGRSEYWSHSSPDACTELILSDSTIFCQTTAGPVQILEGHRVVLTNDSATATVNSAVAFYGAINSNFDYHSPISASITLQSEVSTHGGSIGSHYGVQTHASLGRGNIGTLAGLYVQSPTLELQGAVSNVQVLGNVLTITGTNPFGFAQTNDFVTFYNIGTATFLNGQTVQLTSSTPTSLVANFVHANYGPAADIGDFTFSGVVSGSYGIYIEDQSAGSAVPNPYAIYVVADRSHFEAIEDTFGQIGTSGQVLSSTGTSIAWVDAPTPSFSGWNVVAMQRMQAAGTAGSFAGTTAWVFVPNSAIIATGGAFTLTFACQPSGSQIVKIGNATIRRANPQVRNNIFTANFLDNNPITWGGSATPTFTSPGLYTSDVINVPIDRAHDYWFLVYIDPSTTGNICVYQTAGTATGAETYFAGYNATGDVTSAVNASSWTANYQLGIQAINIA